MFFSVSDKSAKNKDTVFSAKLLTSNPACGGTGILGLRLERAESTDCRASQIMIAESLLLTKIIVSGILDMSEENGRTSHLRSSFELVSASNHVMSTGKSHKASSRTFC